MQLPFEILARTHYAKAEEYWRADRLEAAHAAMTLAMQAGMSPSDVYDRQRTIDAELAARRNCLRWRPTEHLVLELPSDRSSHLHATVLSVAMAAWTDVTETLRVRWGKPVLVAVFQDAESSLFLHARYGYYSERSESHKVCLPCDLLQSAASLRRALLHEVSHAALHNYIGDAVPRWFDEGVAVWMEGGGDSLERRQLRIRASQKDLPSMDQISSLLGSYGTDLDSTAAGVAYVAAGSFVSFVVTRSGIGGLRSALMLSASGEDFGRAFRYATGRGLREWETAWRRALVTG